jgi:hypothetical protein
VLRGDAKKLLVVHSLLYGVAQLEVVTIAPSRHVVMLDQPQPSNEAPRKFPALPAAR